MNPTFRTLGDFLILSIRQPGVAARWLLALDLPAATPWIALAAVSVLGALLTGLGFHLTAAIPPAMAAYYSPILGAGIQAVFTLVAAAVVTGVGRVLGGRGTLAAALLLICWVQAVLLVVQAAQIVFLLTLPLLGELAGLAWIILFFWLMSHAIATLHGFASVALVFLVLLGVMALLGALLMPAMMQIMQMAAEMNGGI